MQLNDGLSLWAHIMCTTAPFTASVFFHKLNWCSTFNITIKVDSLHLQLSWLIEFQGSDKYSTSSQHEYTLTQSNPLSPTEMHSLSEQKGNPSEKWGCDQKLWISAWAGEMWVGKVMSETCSTAFLFVCKSVKDLKKSCPAQENIFNRQLTQTATEFLLITEPTEVQAIDITYNQEKSVTVTETTYCAVC